MSSKRQAKSYRILKPAVTGFWLTKAIVVARTESSMYNDGTKCKNPHDFHRDWVRKLVMFSDLQLRFTMTTRSHCDIMKVDQKDC